MQREGMNAGRFAAVFLAALLAMMVAGGLVGCTSEEADEGSTGSAAVEVIEEETVIDLTVGEVDDDALTMLFENGTGRTIEAVAARQSDVEVDEDDETEGYTELVLSAEAWEDGQVAQVYCADYESSTTDAEGDELVLNAQYDLKFTLAAEDEGGESETVVLHALTFDAELEVTVLLDDETGLAYLSYETDEGTATTLEDEVAVKEEEEAAEAAAAEAAAAEAAAAEAAAASSSSSSTSSSSSSYNYSTSSNSSSSSSGTSSSSSSSSSSTSSSSSSDTSSSDTTSSSSDTSSSDTTSSSSSSASQSEDVCVDESELDLR